MNNAFLFFFFFSLIFFPALIGALEDRFNYVGTVGNDYGVEDWSKVTCTQVGNCTGWPDGWKLGIGWQLEKNNCKWCPAATGTGKCGLHRQSPIDLLRTPATTGHTTEW